MAAVVRLPASHELGHQSRNALAAHRSKRLPVHWEYCGLDRPLAQQPLERCQPPPRVDETDAGRCPALAVAGAESCRHADLGPRTPADAQRRSPFSAACEGERIEERVGRGVIALPGGAEQRASRGEHHEELEIQAGGERVQVPCALDLRLHHLREAFRALL